MNTVAVSLVLLCCLAGSWAAKVGAEGVAVTDETSSDATATSLTTDRSQTELLAELGELRALVLEQRAMLEELRREREVGSKVAFSASSGGRGYWGPFESDVTLQYVIVYTNYGNAYNPGTGVFVAPVRGVYFFTFTVFGLQPSVGMGAALFHNGRRPVSVYKQQGSDYGSNAVTLQMAAGDEVHVRLLAGTQIFDDSYYRNTFSGHLLFTF